ncbi:preprotein translocase subunit SecA [candidate division KSB1 bacterium]|nr:preprotein translocase subunit SecA [candidate division KSB1 bacterium]
MSFLTKIFGDKHRKDIKNISPIVDEINRLYEKYDSLPDEDFPKKTEEFKKEIDDERNSIRSNMEGESKEDIEKAIEEAEKEILEDIMPDAFALVKQACKRLIGKVWNVRGIPTEWNMIPYDVQLVGAVVLHQGKIAEMATGEGKTLAATMPMYLNSLTGRGTHLVTVNDYLAERDSEWMGKVYEFMGLTVGCILNEMNSKERREQYRCDVTYGTNNEFGFDFLRDNMSVRPEDQVQRGHKYAIVDEVDSVLIDEARTPLIISGPVAVSTHMYDKLKPRVERTIKAQAALVNSNILEAEKLLEKKEDYEAGIKILIAHRGAPKNKRLTKLLNEQGIKRLMQGVENDYIRDKKIQDIDEELYYTIDEKRNIADLMEKGRQHMSPENPEMFVLPDLSEETHNIDSNENISEEEKIKKKEELQQTFGQRSEQNHNISQLLRAYSLFEKDVEYVVQDQKVMIVDEFTGRLMPGRRYSDGLHQAIEAKENVKIERESQTLATITLQNYFRMYDILSGMTGTAITEAGEFYEIYKLDCTTIPTNLPIDRDNYDDQLYRTKREKLNAVISEIEEMITGGRPVLVGTISVDVSETLSRMLKRKGVKHSVLNAKQHQQEAEIIANAGRSGNVTIATNMAGRGTDIKLGQGVKEAGGLHIIGTERHESRRIDLQLRGRSARQGDPGSSRFFLSLEDDLMRLFGTDRIARVMDRLGAEEGDVIQHSMITKSIERAQKKVEGHNFSIRKHLLEYDDVMNKQREVIYNRRNTALTGGDLKDEIKIMTDEFVEDKLDENTEAGDYSENWDWEGIQRDFLRTMVMSVSIPENEKNALNKEDLEKRLKTAAHELYVKKEEVLGSDLLRQLERYAVLKVIDEKWRDHLYDLDQVKEGVNLRAYGQKDPLIEYKKESFTLFQDMLSNINEDVLSFIFKARLDPVDRPQEKASQRMVLSHESADGIGYRQPPEMQEAARRGKRQPVKVEKKVGRNDPCPCGSGKKYKKCHGKIA